MRKVMLFLLLACALAQAQQNIAAANQSASVKTHGYASLGVQVTGTWSATLTPQVSIDGVNWVNTQVTPTDTGTAQSTVTANNIFTVAVAGYNFFQLTATIYTSGTAAVTFAANTYASSRGSGAGGGSMTWPSGGAGVPNYSGSSSWGTSYSASSPFPANFLPTTTLFNNPTDNSVALDGLSNRYTNLWLSGVFGWTNGSGTADTGLSRGSAGVIAVGTGANGSTAGTIQATSFAGVGTNGGLSGTEGTGANAGTAGTGTDLLYPDSTSHCWHANQNNSDVGCLGALGKAQTWSATQTFTAPVLGTPASGTATNLTGYLENNMTGAAAAGTITEGGSTFSVTRAGVSTANLTAPWVFQNTNSTNNNTSITLGITAPGTSTGQTVLNVNGASTGGDLADFGTGGTWAAGVLSGQTIVASVIPTGAFVAKGTTAGFIDLPQGTTSSAVSPCNAATSICMQAPTSVTSYLVTLPGAAPAQNGSLRSVTTAGVESFVHTIPANTDPNGGISNFNQAAQSQVVVSATEYYITRSDLDMPAVYSTAIAAGTTMRWRIALTKTAAGTGTFQILLKKGTNGSTADTSIVTQTIGTQTAVADNMECDIQLTWTSATAAYWTIIPRQSAGSGTGFGLVYPAAAAQFTGTISGQTTTTVSDKYGLSVIFTTGTPTFVVNLVTAQAFGVN